MKAFIIFTLISAALASETVVEHNGNQAMVQHQNDQALHIVPRTPDGKLHHYTIENDDGSGEVNILWAPKKVKAQFTYTGDLEDGGNFYTATNYTYYNDDGVGEEAVQNVASNLGLKFEDVKNDDQENRETEYTVEEVE